eukprot:Blabericola_migrator_1__1491@NODE_1394_length_4632_cov_181_340854_g933_i0_p4_GENE_NODE_1394_length_4632_cov_181_340854_g933_i0NODE_1394_length_4632_cov_181_340854_g933_i0_p4_ORF_typecomplete_len209_score31_86ING/PF12998_7/3_4e07NRBF2/PF08961_10/11NRBF2/PF08961_10/12_NODE_1394_length_4632_cov_181_340854_g933_i011301756
MLPPRGTGLRSAEDYLNALSGNITRQLALMLDLDQRAVDIGLQLDELRNTYLTEARQSESGHSPGRHHKTSPTPSKRAPKRRRTPQSARTSTAEQPSPKASLLAEIEKLQALQDRLWAEKLLIGQQCLTMIEHTQTSIADLSAHLAQQLLNVTDASSYTTTVPRTSTRTAALLASQTLHQNLISQESLGGRRGGDTGSSVVSRSRKRH